MSDVPVGVRIQILQDKIQMWHNTYYSHQIDAQIGQDIGDERMVEAAKDNMRKAQQCLDALEKMLSALGDMAAEVGDGQDHSD